MSSVYTQHTQRTYKNNTEQKPVELMLTEPDHAVQNLLAFHQKMTTKQNLEAVLCIALCLGTVWNPNGISGVFPVCMPCCTIPGILC